MTGLTLRFFSILTRGGSGLLPEAPPMRGGTGSRYFAPRYFAPRYFAPRYFVGSDQLPGGGGGTVAGAGRYFAGRYFSAPYFAKRYFA